MIRTEDAIACARGFLGTPYAEMDCIRLIVMVIRRSAGGDPACRCEGTNWLWRSLMRSRKYRHIVWRQEGTQGARAGMLAFKRRGEDVHHVGLVTDEDTVIHSSSVQGKVVETPLDGSWHLLAQHRDIAVMEERGGPGQTENADSSAVGEELCSLPGHAREECGGALLLPDAAPERGGAGAAQEGSPALFTSLVREADGVCILLEGRWRVAED